MSGVVLRQVAKEAPKLARGFKSAKPVMDAGHDAPHYLHAPTMYETWNIKNKELKWGATAIGFLAGGFGIPVIAVLYQQKKAKG